MLGICTTAKEIRNALQEIDQEGDGLISWDEFLIFMAKHLTDSKINSKEMELAFEGAPRGHRPRRRVTTLLRVPTFRTAHRLPCLACVFRSNTRQSRDLRSNLALARRSRRSSCGTAVLVSQCELTTLEEVRLQTAIVAELFAEPLRARQASKEEPDAASSSSGLLEQSKWRSMRKEGTAAAAAAAAEAAAAPGSPAAGSPAAGAAASDAKAGSRSGGGKQKLGTPTKASQAKQGYGKVDPTKDVLRAQLYRKAVEARKAKGTATASGAPSAAASIDPGAMLDVQMLELILTDAGAPFDAGEMKRFRALADPFDTGQVSLERLRGLPCWQTLEEEEASRRAKEQADYISEASRSLQRVARVTVPEGVSPGEVLAVETDRGTFKARVPPGVAPGESFDLQIAPGAPPAAQEPATTEPPSVRPPSAARAKSAAPTEQKPPRSGPVGLLASLRDTWLAPAPAAATTPPSAPAAGSSQAPPQSSREANGSRGSGSEQGSDPDTSREARQSAYAGIYRMPQSMYLAGNQSARTDSEAASPGGSLEASDSGHV